jgi:D-sedoheptulose 7-phosphate isomerase
MDKKFNKLNFIHESLLESAKTKEDILKYCSNSIDLAIDLMVNSVKNGGKILFIGNGGSAADSQHLATEFMIRLNHEISRPPIPAIALTTDSSNLTAGGNDIGYENIFARNVAGLAISGDILIAISTSGNSENIVKAVKIATEKSVKVIGFLGGNGGKLKDLVDVAILIPSENVQRIQEGHITVGHILCESVEQILYGK